MKVYYRGEYSDADKVSVDSGLPHFRYGMGFFETLLYDGEKLHDLDQHLERLYNACATFGLTHKPADIADIINQLITANNLIGCIARVNVCQMAISMEETETFVSVLPYTPPPADKVMRLCLYPHVHESYLAKYKSMNYMHCMLAKKFATDNGCDDAILIDAKGDILETATAAIVLEKDGHFYTSRSEKRLDSITLQKFANNNKLKEIDINIKDIIYYQIYVLNSLSGMRKAEFISIQ